MLVKPAYEIAALIRKNLISYSEGLGVLTKAATNFIPPYPKNLVLQMLKSALNKAELTTGREYYGMFSNRSDLWETATNFSQQYPWHLHGRGAQMDKAVFTACCIRCRKDRGQPFRGSLRELSELANVYSLKSVSNSLARLIFNGLLHRIDTTKGGVYRYSFSNVVISPKYYSNTTCKSNVVMSDTPNESENDRQDLLNDIFSKFGRISLACWEHLIDNPERSLSAISKNMFLNYSSVYKALPKLIKNGFVTYSPSEGMYIGEDLPTQRLAEIALKNGVLGKSKNRRMFHVRERQIRVNQMIFQKRNELANYIRNDNYQLRRNDEYQSSI